MSVLKTTVFNAGTTQGVAVPANLSRKNLIIQNKHASNTLKVKFGSAIVGTDVTQIQTLTFGNVPTAGSIVLTWNGNNSAGIVSTDAASDVQTKLRAVTGLSSVTVTGSFTLGFVITLTGVTPQFFASDPALTIFSNSLNIAQVTEVETVSFDAVPDAGSFKLNFGGHASSTILSSANSAAVQTAVRTIAGLGSATVSGDFTGGFVVTMTGTTGPQALMTVTNNTLTSTSTPVVVTVTETTPGVAPAATTATIAVTTPGAYADGFFIGASNVSLTFAGGDSTPGDAVYIVASGSATRVEIIEGF